MGYSSKKILTVAIIAGLMLSPSISFAKSNQEKKIEKQNEKVEKRIAKLENKIKKNEEKLEKRAEWSDGRCWSFFVRRNLPFGWLRANWENIDLDSVCPQFGQKPGKATTTPDTTAPIISDIRVRTGHTRALVAWETNEKSSAKIYYSTTSPATTGSPSVIGYNYFSKNHYALIQGLSSSTTYYFLIEVKDKFGNTTLSPQSSFTTKSSAVLPDTLAPIISSINTSVSSSSISVSWNTNEAATSKVYYSTSTPLNTSTANFVQTGSLTMSHNLVLENLLASTTYYLLIEATDSSINTATSSQFSTTTGS